MLMTVVIIPQEAAALCQYLPSPHMTALAFPRRRCSALKPPPWPNTAGLESQPRSSSRTLMPRGGSRVWANHSLATCKATAQPPLIQIVSPPHSLKVKPRGRSRQDVTFGESFWTFFSFFSLLFSNQRPNRVHAFRLARPLLAPLPWPSIYTHALVQFSSQLFSF